MGDSKAANLMHHLKAGELSHADFIEDSERYRSKSYRI